MNNAFILFIICTFANVVLSTVRSVMTIKGSKLSAAIWNALSFGLYAYIVVLTASAPITTLDKVLITAICNLIGVYVVKLIEEKMRKDKLWKIELTVPSEKQAAAIEALTSYNIPFNYIENIGHYTIFNVYASTQDQTNYTTILAEKIGAKSFASETKLTF